MCTSTRSKHGILSEVLSNVLPRSQETGKSRHGNSCIYTRRKIKVTSLFSAFIRVMFVFRLNLCQLQVHPQDPSVSPHGRRAILAHSEETWASLHQQRKLHRHLFIQLHPLKLCQDLQLSFLPFVSIYVKIST
jgi:hypothetical protein